MGAAVCTEHYSFFVPSATSQPNRGSDSGSARAYERRKGLTEEPENNFAAAAAAAVSIKRRTDGRRDPTQLDQPNKVMGNY